MELREALAWCKEVVLFSAGSGISNHAPFAFSRHFFVPPVTEPGWLHALKRVISDHGITHIFPAHDDTLLALAESASELSAKLVTSPLETCRITRSKSATLRLLKDEIPTPRLYGHIDEIDQYPVFTKPDRGQGAQGAARAATREALAQLLSDDPRRIILEDLPGEEFTIDCFSDRTRGLLYASGRSRARIKTGIAMASQIENLPEFTDYARRIELLLPLHGAWFFQTKRDRSGTLRLLEVAPRIAGTSALSRARGVNLPLLSLYEAERIPVTITTADYDVNVDRALRNRYRHSLDYNTIYVDFDDTLVVHGRIHYDLIKLLYQALHRGAKLVLLTRHAGDLSSTLRRFRLENLFDSIIHLKVGEMKADFVKERAAIFIDDSHAERQLVHQRTRIPVFSPAMVDALLDERL